MRQILRARLAMAAAVAFAVFFVAATLAEESVGNSITVVYNHEGAAAADLVKRGGFSAFVQFEDRSLVLDAGGEASVTRW